MPHLGYLEKIKMINFILHIPKDGDIIKIVQNDIFTFRDYVLHQNDQDFLCIFCFQKKVFTHKINK